MKKAVIEADSYAPVEEVFDFIRDFENYEKYSKYVSDIRRVSDDGPEWEIDFEWWIVNYTARSKLVEVEENEYIEWQVTKDVDVVGRWEFDEVDDEHTKIRLHLWYDPQGASKANPLRYFPTKRLIQIAKPVGDRHARDVLRKVAAEVEGEEREVDYTIRPAEQDEGDQLLAMFPDDKIDESGEPG